MTRYVLSLVLLSACARTVVVEEPASAGHYVLGETTVLGREPVVHVAVSSPGAYRALQLEVHHRGVHVDQLLVTFENGATHSFPVREFLRPGSHTRWIDFPGGARRIRSIQLTMERRGPIPGRAFVRVLGAT